MVWKDLEPYDNPQVKFDDDLFAWYQRLIAINGKPLSPSQQAEEDAKYQHEMAARQNEPRNRRAARW